MKGWGRRLEVGKDQIIPHLSQMSLYGVYMEVTYVVIKILCVLRSRVCDLSPMH